MELPSLLKRRPTRTELRITPSPIPLDQVSVTLKNNRFGNGPVVFVIWEWVEWPLMLAISSKTKNDPY